MTVLALAGEGAQNKTTSLPDRLMAALTNLQKTGSTAGLGRFDVTFESPARAVGLALGGGALDISFARRLSARGARRRGARIAHERRPGDRRARAPPAAGPRGRVDAPAEALLALGRRHAARRPVDRRRRPSRGSRTRRSSLRDTYRRVTFQPGHDATDVVATADPPPPPLDTSQASVEEAHWPPPSIPTIWKSPEPARGRVGRAGRPVAAQGAGRDARRAVPVLPDLRPPRRGPARTRASCSSRWTCASSTSRWRPGVEDPEPLTGPHGNGRIPRDPAICRRRRGRLQRRLQDRARALRDDGQEARPAPARPRRGDRRGPRRRARRLRDLGDRQERGRHRRRRRRRDRLVPAEPRPAHRPRPD